MVDTQHFCLRWNNYQSSITSAFENLRDDEDFVDVTLACDGKSLKAHRVVLSACSPYFRELLKSTPCKHPVIVLQDVAFSDLHALVEFIYHGEVNVHQRSLSSFLKTAEVLRVSGLTQQADQTDRDELSHVRALAAGNHLPTHEKLPEENFLRGNSSPPSAATMPVPTSLHQQIFHKSQIRKSEIHPYNTQNDKIKRARLPSPPLNNNDAIPTDFSMIKSNHLSSKIEGNGLNEDSSHVEENIKCEPLELTGGNGGGNGGNHDDSSNSEAAASDRPPASASSNEHDPEPEHPPPSYLPSESKLFTTTPGTYNFTMSALTTDHSPLSVKFPGLGHGLQTTDLAGTSQDREVAEEDGGWQSAGGGTIGTGCKNDAQQQRQQQQQQQQQQRKTVDGVTTEVSDPRSPVRTENNCRHLENRGGPSTPDQFPMIDLLDADIDDPMQIVFKTEPMSPKIETVADLESCLLLRQDDRACESGNFGNPGNPGSKGDGNDAAITSFAHNRNDLQAAVQVLPSLHEIRRRPLTIEPEVISNGRSAGAATYCTFCQKTFSRAWSLQRHLADTHFYVPQSLACDQCGRSYKSRNSLVSHKSQYHAKRERKDIQDSLHCEMSY
ncbi:broad-complex core protein isoform X1 [Neodiprion fabricii]|uniref:broad-complex core protein isoform X1 n=1 Tax=Neodiprion fabricii TaxID=2872261 RepID=UPI001ED90FA9|nr:broad-complex core protein isoform X1 [Neodiprion fabricii]XP_046414702.1 broad-complex core protein isoform X1 [Neodiprion fabricii]XP_046414703.1 broad-complex core protein isoform X1 [Neodiprion fabricii]XP_046414704.1 broad-complex core protein isoform X1 [Neodiprion fabricii]XP_046414705.1 broad-complex core protein isoform X1 [Neodiprion fabricii]XP_046414706.1 broad-complex core protein isoform X1 [Neodiprion fabricii]XP_046414707.1 broad-complex core protein isoform X1 [Neodiprion 